MITGLFVVGFGVLIALFPQLLSLMVAGVFVLFGLGMMATSWQFRRMQKQSESRFINWIIRW